MVVCFHVKWKVVSTCLGRRAWDLWRMCKLIVSRGWRRDHYYNPTNPTQHNLYHCNFRKSITATHFQKKSSNGKGIMCWVGLVWWQWALIQKATNPCTCWRPIHSNWNPLTLILSLPGALPRVKFVWKVPISKVIQIMLRVFTCLPACRPNPKRMSVCWRTRVLRS